MDPFRHDSFLAPGFSHHYDPKTSAVLAELRESFTEMDEEDWDLHRKRQFTRQRHEDKRKLLVSLRTWMDDKLAVSITSEEDDNRPDYRYTGCTPVTHDKVALPEDNRRSVCGSLGCAPITMDSKHSSEDNGAHSHCVFLGCAPLTICEQAVPPTMGAGFYAEPVYPSAEVMHAGVIYFQTVFTQCLSVQIFGSEKVIGADSTPQSFIRTKRGRHVQHLVATVSLRKIMTPSEDDVKPFYAAQSRTIVQLLHAHLTKLRNLWESTNSRLVVEPFGDQRLINSLFNSHTERIQHQSSFSHGVHIREHVLTGSQPRDFTYWEERS
ncbi:hypothetical protein CLF_100430 [Clonorchis sinensis]|uniref:Uncharacterized protein n=1 Tax=Clonorchis sinensis TaxID=79923 RepID=G7Y3F6_CLOSI|nr:hypothetical protein CLF_100430 [Clonorchis sinensis]